MLETVRQYALEQLSQRGEVAAVRERHLAHYLALAEEMNRQLAGDAAGRWIARLDPDRDNLFRALGWCSGGDRARHGLQMVVALRHYWSSRGLLVRGYEVTVAALAHPGARPRDLWRCGGKSAAALQCYWMGRHPEAIAHAEESLAIATEIGDDERRIIAMRQVAQACRALGDAQRAFELVEEALVLARGIGNQLQVCDSLIVLGQLHMHDEDHTRAEPLFEEVLALRKRLSHPDFAIAIATFNLASIAISHGLPDRARARLVAASALTANTESRYLGQHLLDEVSALAALTGEFELSVRWHAASVQQREEIHMPGLPFSRERSHHIGHARAALGATACAAAEAAGAQLGHEAALAQARNWLGH